MAASRGRHQPNMTSTPTRSRTAPDFDLSASPIEMSFDSSYPLSPNTGSPPEPSTSAEARQPQAAVLPARARPELSTPSGFSGFSTSTFSSDPSRGSPTEPSPGYPQIQSSPPRRRLCCRLPYADAATHLSADTAAARSQESDLYSDALADPYVEPKKDIPAPPSPEQWKTPVIQRRGAPIRRFNCKRRLTFTDTKEWVMSGIDCSPPNTPEVLELSPPPSPLQEHHRKKLNASARRGGCMDTIYGPLPQHIYVPLWLYTARTYPEIFQEALDYFFKNTAWPPLTDMDLAFQDVCEEIGITEDMYRRTFGFAPAWVFILNVFSKGGNVNRQWFDICIEHFFEDGKFPDLHTMPMELQNAAKIEDVGEFDFYVSDV